MGDGQILRFAALMLALLTVMTVITVAVVAWPAATPVSTVPGGTDAGDSTSETVDPSGKYPIVTNWKNIAESSAPSISLPSGTPTFGNEVKSAAAILVDMATGSATYAKAADERVHIASMTKVMTLIVSLDLIKSNDAFFAKVQLDPATRAALAQGGYQLAFNKDDREAYVIDLLYTLILQSGCDSACALAKHLAGSEENFVALMNEKATALGLTGTHFANSYGGDDDNN